MKQWIIYKVEITIISPDCYKKLSIIRSIYFIEYVSLWQLAENSKLTILLPVTPFYSNNYWLKILISFSWNYIEFCVLVWWTQILGFWIIIGLRLDEQRRILRNFQLDSWKLIVSGEICLIFCCPHSFFRTQTGHFDLTQNFSHNLNIQNSSLCSQKTPLSEIQQKNIRKIDR